MQFIHVDEHHIKSKKESIKELVNIFGRHDINLTGLHSQHT